MSNIIINGRGAIWGVNFFKRGGRAMNNIIVNGRAISVSGNNISIINDAIYVDGKKIEGGLSGAVEVSFTGDICSLKCDGEVTIKGNVLGNIDCGGSCECGDVGGYVDAGGSVRCGKVNGDVDAGGSVRISKD